MTRRHWIHEAGRQGNRRFCDALVLLCSVVHVNRFSKEVSITIEKIFQLAGYHLLKKHTPPALSCIAPEKKIEV